MYRFETLEDVQSALEKLTRREPPLVKVLPRQLGTKEPRWAHLLAGDVVVLEAAETTAFRDVVADDRMTRLEREVAELRKEVAELKDQSERFRKQFE
jgi:uncharacterized protein YceH (UPF0502 family)